MKSAINAASEFAFSIGCFRALIHTVPEMGPGPVTVVKPLSVFRNLYLLLAGEIANPSHQSHLADFESYVRLRHRYLVTMLFTNVF